MDSRAPRVTVVGSINMDVLIDVAALPLPHQTVTAHGLRRTIGGKGLNQAVAAARMGASVRMVATVGGDADGAAACAHLAAQGIDTAHVASLPGVATGAAHILVAADGSNMIAITPGANAAFGPTQVQAAEAAIVDADIVVVQLETPVDAVHAVLSIARRHGVRTILNPAPADRTAIALLPLADLVTPNETELETLTGQSATGRQATLAGLSDLTNHGAGAAIVTLGGQGSMALQGGVVLDQPSFAVPVVDTTGAGDVYNGALACALASGATLASAMRVAAAAAALSVSHASADSAPMRSEVDLLLAEAGR